MVTEHTHIHKEGLDLVLTDVPVVVGVRVGSPFGASDSSIVFYRCCAVETYPSLGV